VTAWVVRTSLQGDTVGEPRLCAKPGGMVRVPGLLTIDEQIPILLLDGEIVQNHAANRRWKIFAGNQQTGFIEVRD
jgi:hypothetical protein